MKVVWWFCYRKTTLVSNEAKVAWAPFATPQAKKTCRMSPSPTAWLNRLVNGCDSSFPCHSQVTCFSGSWGAFAPALYDVRFSAANWRRTREIPSNCHQDDLSTASSWNETRQETRKPPFPFVSFNGLLKYFSFTFQQRAAPKRSIFPSDVREAATVCGLPPCVGGRESGRCFCCQHPRRRWSLTHSFHICSSSGSSWH